MRPVLVLQNDADVPLGHLRGALDEAAVPCEVRRLYAGDSIPDARAWPGIIVLGGAMGVYDAPSHPFLGPERDMLASAVGAGVPVLGICLGCQLLADALGGRAYRASRVEARFEIFTSPDAAADPVLRHLDGPQLSFHRDTWDAPPGSAVLLESSQYPQAFRLGSALGIQSHPEVTPEVARSWMESASGHEMLAESGVDGAAIAAAMATNVEASKTMAGRFFTAWLAEAGQAVPGT